MPKDGFLTPKAIANRIKAKGLQKLKWYCQACEKQCRDENGFKCHTQSESHQRQILLVGESKGRHIANYSLEFKNTFVRLLSTRFGTRRVFANQVYQDYISDRHHIHMNATRWTTLTGFVQYLGKSGICNIDETEKGWWIQWIDQRPETLEREGKWRKKMLNYKDEEMREKLLIEEQVKSSKRIEEEAATDLQRDGDGPVRLSINWKKPADPGFEGKPDDSSSSSTVQSTLSAAKGSSAPTCPLKISMQADPPKRKSLKTLMKSSTPANDTKKTDTHTQSQLSTSCAGKQVAKTNIERLREMEESRKRRAGNSDRREWSKRRRF